MFKQLKVSTILDAYSVTCFSSFCKIH